MRRIRAVAVFLSSLILATSAAAAEFPAGTIRFFDTRATSAIPASGGGVWVGTPAGLVHYTEAGAGAILSTPGGGAPRHLVVALDGSIWYVADTLVARIATNGAILEQHPMSGAGVTALAVASDGALWYSSHGPGGQIVGRIAGNLTTEFPSPTDTWSLAPASNGQMWVLGDGFGVGSSSVYKMTPTGAVTELRLGYDHLFGRLQALPDGTLYIGTGFNSRVLRLAPGAGTVEKVNAPASEFSEFLSDSAGDLWIGGYQVLAYISRYGLPNLPATMPGDPRQLQCSHNIPVYLYQPVAIDSAGGLWVRISNGAFFIGETPPCQEPEPPPMPDLIRIDTTRFVAEHVPASAIPMVPRPMLAALALVLAFVTIWRLRV